MIKNVNKIYNNAGSYPTVYNELDFKSVKSLQTKSLLFRQINTLCLANICKFLSIEDTKFFRMLNKKCSVAAEIAMHNNFEEFIIQELPDYEKCLDIEMIELSTDDPLKILDYDEEI